MIFLPYILIPSSLNLYFLQDPTTGAKRKSSGKENQNSGEYNQHSGEYNQSRY